MRWDNDDLSENVEKRTGGGGGMRTIGIGGGIGTVIIIVLALLFKQDPRDVMQVVQQQGGGGAETSQQVTVSNPEEERFASAVLGITERVWTTIFNENNMTYEKPKMVLFEKATTSGCGFAQDAMGPFYCPADRKVYLDISFFKEMEQQMGVSGEFARAYVIAHEVGHHVQNLLGISNKVQGMRSRLSETEYNKLSVKLELQADFFAGVWANRANRTDRILEPGDIESAINAASAVGDDKLQQAGQGYVVPDAFTHGTSKQRMYWFKKGFESGDMNQGDTFNSKE